MSRAAVASIANSGLITRSWIGRGRRPQLTDSCCVQSSTYVVVASLRRVLEWPMLCVGVQRQGTFRVGREYLSDSVAATFIIKAQCQWL